MEEIVQWIEANKAWAFSGIGGVIISIVASLLIKSRTGKSNSQKISGKGHTTLQDVKGKNITISNQNRDV